MANEETQGPSGRPDTTDSSRLNRRSESSRRPTALSKLNTTLLTALVGLVSFFGQRIITQLDNVEPRIAAIEMRGAASDQIHQQVFFRLGQLEGKTEKFEDFRIQILSMYGLKPEEVKIRRKSNQDDEKN